MTEPGINGERLWNSLMELARIGATERGGVCRLALTEEDRRGRDLFVRWCEEAGCRVRVDAMGNIFARRAGREDTLAPVLSGSHLDSQPTGGKFDGAYGVMAALEAVRTLNDHGIETRRPLEIVSWTNEEGSRFAPAMVGSGVWAGAFDLDYGHSRTDADGVRLGQALAAIGYAGVTMDTNERPAAYLEAHIEQGPILEQEGQTIGVVLGVQGMRWFEITVTGQDAHAGPTPMEGRRDALLAAARAIVAVNQAGLSQTPDGRATVGVIRNRSNSTNVIPGEVFFSVDLRHPQVTALDVMEANLREQCEAIAADSGTGFVMRRIWDSPPVAFADPCIDAVRAGAQTGGYRHRDIYSGAGHDAVYVARVAPTGMIFVPCAGGLSHNEQESATPEDLAAGGDVLLRAMFRLADT